MIFQLILFIYILVSYPMHYNALSSKIKLVSKSIITNILLLRQSKK